MDLNKFAQEIYAQNKQVGWWDDPNRCPFECLQLCSTEVAEATEGYRRSLKDDHLPHRDMEEVELADTLIRVLDFGAHHNLKHDVKIQHEPLLDIENLSIAGYHLAINRAITLLSVNFEGNDLNIDFSDECYSLTINTILEVAGRRGFDILTAAKEKHAYNKTRADHKRENRIKEFGKKI